MICFYRDPRLCFSECRGLRLHKRLEETGLFFQVVSFILSISSVLWVTMAKGSRQKRSHQDVGSVNAEPRPVLSGQGGVDTRKKARTDLENQGNVYFECYDCRYVPDLVFSSALFFKRKQREWRSSGSTSNPRAPPNAGLSQDIEDGRRHRK